MKGAGMHIIKDMSSKDRTSLSFGLLIAAITLPLAIDLVPLWIVSSALSDQFSGIRLLTFQEWRAVLYLVILLPLHLAAVMWAGYWYAHYKGFFDDPEPLSTA